MLRHEKVILRAKTMLIPSLIPNYAHSNPRSFQFLRWLNIFDNIFFDPQSNFDFENKKLLC